MLEPKVEARMLQDLHVQPHEKVLEVGAGSGYMAALLSRRAQRVISLELDPELARMARANLQRAGITKLMISEARNFPELAAFYQQEVIKPGQDLIRGILQRGVERGEFHVPDLDYALFSITAPMIFLIMMKHSLGACVPQDYPLDPERYIASQAETLLHGLCVRPKDPLPSTPPAGRGRK
jgi:SAM-dependent methyltransferase